MNRFVRVSMFLAVLLAFAAVPALAQGQKGMLERKMWYVDENGKVGPNEALYWRIFLGDYNIKIKRNIHGEGDVTFEAGMNFQFLSSGYIEGNGHSSKGKVSSLPGMRIRVEGAQSEEIKLEEIDYIYDYGGKVAAKDGRKGEFLIGGEGPDLELKRFQLTEYKQFKGSFGELELKEVKDRQPIRAMSFTKEGAARAAKEAVSY